MLPSSPATQGACGALSAPFGHSAHLPAHCPHAEAVWEVFVSMGQLDPFTLVARSPSPLWICLSQSMRIRSHHQHHHENPGLLTGEASPHISGHPSYPLRPSLEVVPTEVLGSVRELVNTFYFGSYCEWSSVFQHHSLHLVIFVNNDSHSFSLPVLTPFTSFLWHCPGPLPRAKQR